MVSGPAVQQGSRTTELEALVAALGQRLTDAEESAAGSAADLASAAAERDRALADLQVTGFTSRALSTGLQAGAWNKDSRSVSGVKGCNTRGKDSRSHCLRLEQLELLLFKANASNLGIANRLFSLCRLANHVFRQRELRPRSSGRSAAGWTQRSNRQRAAAVS